jgi:hypothetical protein
LQNTDIQNTDIKNTDIRNTDMDTDMNYVSNTLRILKNKLSFSNIDVKVFNDQLQVCYTTFIYICIYHVSFIYICIFERHESNTFYVSFFSG